jgi:aspartate/methionine/tyrosine aminotransferase
MQVMARAQALQAVGRAVIHLEVGEPDFATPAPVVAAAGQAMQAGAVRYTPAEGLAPLRVALAADYQRLYGLSLDPARIVLTAGASAALLLALLVATDVGDTVLLPDPGYACNRAFVASLGAQPRPIPVRAAQGFQPTGADLAAAWEANTRAVLLASPANPTGTLLPAGELAALARFVRQQGGVLILDEIYHRLVFDQPPTTGLTLDDEIVVVNSFSKYAAMTGWRLGWMVVPPAWIDPVQRLAQNLFIAPSTLAQQAALALFTPETEALLQSRVQELARRRDFLVDALPALGLDIRAQPQGAFYVFADCSAWGADSEAICARILEEAGVALTPGTDFSPTCGRSHLRIAYTQPLEQLAEAVTRLQRLRW